MLKQPVDLQSNQPASRLAYQLQVIGTVQNLKCGSSLLCSAVISSDATLTRTCLLSQKQYLSFSFYRMALYQLYIAY